MEWILEKVAEYSFRVMLWAMGTTRQDYFNEVFLNELEEQQEQQQKEFEKEEASGR